MNAFASPLTLVGEFDLPEPQIDTGATFVAIDSDAATIEINGNFLSVFIEALWLNQVRDIHLV